MSNTEGLSYSDVVDLYLREDLVLNDQEVNDVQREIHRLVVETYRSEDPDNYSWEYHLLESEKGELPLVYLFAQGKAKKVESFRFEIKRIIERVVKQKAFKKLMKNPREILADSDYAERKSVSVRRISRQKPDFTRRGKKKKRTAKAGN